MADLTHFSLSDMAEFSSALRGIGSGAGSLEETAERLVGYFYDRLRDRRTEERCCAMVRFYKTHRYSELDDGLRAFARRILGEQPESPHLKCLILLSTAGDLPEWNSRSLSASHQAIPLASEPMVAAFPMISQLIIQFGLEPSAIVRPNPALLLDLDQRSYNVFHVPEALGSPYVPAQAGFVVPHQIRSVLGFGGLLPTADLFAVILFSRSFIPRETADLFRTLALSVKVAILPFLEGATFR